MRRVVAKCARSKVSDERKECFGKTQVGCGTCKAEIAAHLFRKILEKPSSKTHVLLKLDFKNAFISLNSETMLKHVHAIRPNVYLLVFSACSQPNFLIYGDTIISSDEGTQRGDPEAPPIFAETTQVLVNDMKSKINEWYLDDESLANDYKITRS